MKFDIEAPAPMPQRRGCEPSKRLRAWVTELEKHTTKWLADTFLDCELKPRDTTSRVLWATQEATVITTLGKLRVSLDLAFGCVHCQFDTAPTVDQLAQHHGRTNRLNPHSGKYNTYCYIKRPSVSYWLATLDDHLKALAPATQTAPQEQTMAKNTITVDGDGCFRIESNTLIWAPGIARSVSMAGPPPFDQEGQETAAKLYWLASCFPHAPACVLLAIIEGRYTIEEGIVAVRMTSETTPVSEATNEPSSTDG